MRAGSFALLIAIFGLAGCDRLSGEAEQKIFDAEAVGYACRISLKVPEDCMKENEAHSPTYILKGWKTADKAIADGLLDPRMGKDDHTAAATAPVPSLPIITGMERKAADEKSAKKVPDVKTTIPKAATTNNKANGH